MAFADLADTASATALPDGRKAITLVAKDGARTPIGHVTFSPDGDGAKIDVKLDAPQFQEEFLSMRPFRCLDDAKQMWCHLAYPYGTAMRVTANDLVDLEYELMFLWRSPVKVGIDAWNGLYFKLAPQADGSLGGRLHEADFNVLAVPPDTKLARPVTHKDLTLAEPGTHRFVAIEIK